MIRNKRTVESTGFERSCKLGNRFIAGTAVADISPEQGIELTGYPHYERANTGIHDPLYASCIYLDDGQTRIAWISLDLTKYSKQYVQKVRERIFERTGIPQKNIMITCTHTHSGPLAAGRYDMEGLRKSLVPDAGYIAFLEDRLVHVVDEACRHPFSAMVGMEKGTCGREQGVGGNRRDPDGAADPDVWVLGIRDTEGRWRACLVEYALHPTFIHGESKVVSADYPCYLRRYLEETKPGINVLFMQGTSGNQSSRFFRIGQTYAEAERVGRSLGMEADRVLDAMECHLEARISVRSIETGLEIKTFPSKTEAEKCVEIAKSILDEKRTSHASYIETRNAEVGLLGAENTLGHVLALETFGHLAPLNDELPAEIQVFGIGDARIIGIQGEIFVEFGLAIKSESPFSKTCVIELANGVLPGYVCTAKAFEEGGYEAGSSLMTASAGEMLVRKTCGLLKEEPEESRP